MSSSCRLTGAKKNALPALNSSQKDVIVLFLYYYVAGGENVDVLSPQLGIKLA